MPVLTRNIIIKCETLQDLRNYSYDEFSFVKNSEILNIIESCVELYSSDYDSIRFELETKLTKLKKEIN